LILFDHITASVSQHPQSFLLVPRIDTGDGIVCVVPCLGEHPFGLFEKVSCGHVP
jgi:hypothetical protein